MAHDLEPFEGAGFVLAQACFMAGDAQLLFNGIHAVKIRQQQSAFPSVTDDDAVALYVEHFGGIDRLRLAENVDADLKARKLIRGNGREARIVRTGAHCVLNDLLGNALAGRRDVAPV